MLHCIPRHVRITVRRDHLVYDDYRYGWLVVLLDRFGMPADLARHTTKASAYAHARRIRKALRGG